MVRVEAIVALVGVLVAQAAPKVAPPNLSGEWKLISSTSNGERGEQPTKRFVADERAFNCGRECRIVVKGSTVTIENAQLKDDATASSPAVTIALDGQPHTVIDSNSPGKSHEVTGRWDNGRLILTTVLYGRPVTQTISVENAQLVVATAATATTLVFRYARK